MEITEALLSTVQQMLIAVASSRGDMEPGEKDAAAARAYITFDKPFLVGSPYKTLCLTIVECVTPEEEEPWVPEVQPSAN